LRYSVGLHLPLTGEGLPRVGLELLDPLAQNVLMNVDLLGRPDYG
jgi:hypothetical protein